MKRLPKIFIASSSTDKSKSAAQHLAGALNTCADIDCWFDEGIFRNGEYTMNELNRIANSYDMGIFLFNDDDEIVINEKEMVITRDNVILEYGMFVSVVGPENCFILSDASVKNLRMPSDVSGLTYIKYDGNRQDIRYALRGNIAHIKGVINDWSPEVKVNRYFENFYSTVEPELKNNQPIGYNRSFNLLLHMFGSQHFKEFRAFDLAFSRWEETFNDRDKISSQITNYSKDILATTREMYRRKRCTDFRRIIVIATLGGVTKKTIEVLQLIGEMEQEVIAFHPKGIFETRVLGVNQWDHKLDFNTHNDFALFTGESDEFAIVEITLTSPYSSAGPGHCIIIDDPEGLQRRKNFFDSVWQEEAVSIGDFINAYDKADVSDTITQAVDALHQRSVSGSTGVIIETAYVELIKLNDKRRNVPFERAFELLSEVSASSKFKGNIFLDAFINDFRPKSKEPFECSESCEMEDITDDKTFWRLKGEITKQLNLVNSSFNISEEMITTFYMTKTRNNAITKFKNLLVQKQEQFYFEERGDGTEDVYLASKRINLGYRRGDAIVPNCAFLMAEHYHNLFCFVANDKPALNSIWIFDFLIYNEKKYVEQGAQTAIALFTWPQGKSLNIINCTYEPDGTGDMRHLGPYQF